MISERFPLEMLSVHSLYSCCLTCWAHPLFFCLQKIKSFAKSENKVPDHVTLSVFLHSLLHTQINSRLLEIKLACDFLFFLIYLNGWLQSVELSWCINSNWFGITVLLGLVKATSRALCIGKWTFMFTFLHNSNDKRFLFCWHNNITSS